MSRIISRRLSELFATKKSRNHRDPSAPRASASWHLSGWSSCKSRLLLSATVTWTGKGTDANWSTPGNWSGGFPATGDILVFPSAARMSNVDDITGLSVAEIQFTATGYSISGTSTLTLKGTGSPLIDNVTGTNALRLPTAWR